MVSRYVKGRMKENRVKKLLMKNGFFVVRSSRSLSPADLVALKKGVKPLLIQVKLRKRIGRGELEKLLEASDKAGGIGVAVFGNRALVNGMEIPLRRLARYVEEISRNYILNF